MYTIVCENRKYHILNYTLALAITHKHSFTDGTCYVVGLREVYKYGFKLTEYHTKDLCPCNISSFYIF